MCSSEHDTIKNIINVNYAGEFGAIRLYRAQINIAKLFHRDLLGTLHNVLQDEEKHCKLLREIMPKYNMIPCRLTWIWGVAGYCLGSTTAILGRRHLLICMKAAENTAHEHLAAQAICLIGKDDHLAKTILDIDKEEHSHVKLSEQHLGSGETSAYEAALYKIIYKICQATMWIVTRGKSSELKKALA